MNRLHPDDIQAIVRGVIVGIKQREELSMDFDHMVATMSMEEIRDHQKRKARLRPRKTA